MQTNDFSNQLIRERWVSKCINHRIVSTGSFWLTGSHRLIGPTWFTKLSWYRIYVTGIRKYRFCELSSFIHSDWYIDWSVQIFGIIFLSVCIMLHSFNDIWIQFNDNLYINNNLIFSLNIKVHVIKIITSSAWFKWIC